MSNKDFEDNPGPDMTGSGQGKPTLRRSNKVLRGSRTDALRSIPENEGQTMMPLPGPPAPPANQGGPEIALPDARRPDLSWQSPHILQFAANEENPEVARNLLLLHQDRDDFDMTIECSGRVWKLHRRFAKKSAYLRTEFRVTDPRPHLTLQLENINLTTHRVDMYLLWLYTRKFTVISRWVDKLWPEDDLEGILEILALAAVLPNESLLFHYAHKEVQERFATKLWILSDEEAVDGAKQARTSVDHCLEILFEQETKNPSLNPLRAAVMVEFFKKAGQLLPKHKWLEQWIGRSPAFKAAFRVIRQELLNKGKIARGPSAVRFRDVDDADARCEEFRDTWLGDEGDRPAPAPAPFIGPALPPGFRRAPPSGPEGEADRGRSDNNGDNGDNGGGGGGKRVTFVYENPGRRNQSRDEW